MKLKKPKYIYLVYQNGKLDCVEFTKKRALEMSTDPENGREPYHVERWEKEPNGDYAFDITFQKATGEL